MGKINKFKVTFVGDQNVGKTSIISRFIQDTFEPTSNVYFYLNIKANSGYRFRNKDNASIRIDTAITVMGYCRSVEIPITYPLICKRC